MENWKETMSRDLFRQRRNLLVSSCMLLAIKFLGLEFKEIYILGTKAQINDPDSIFYLVFIFWTYFLIRFIQYLYNEWHTVKSRYTKSLLIVLEMYFYKKLGVWFVLDKKGVDITYKTFLGLEEFIMYNSTNKEIGPESKRKLLKLNPDNINRVNLPFTDRFKVCLKAFFRYIFQSASTDYFLPIIIALLTIYYCHSLMVSSVVFIWGKI